MSKKKKKTKKKIKRKQSKDEEIAKLKAKLAKLQTSEIDPLIVQKLNEFREIGLLFKTRNFFADYKVDIDSYHVHILKEDAEEVVTKNIDRSFILKEINEELHDARERARKAEEA